MEVVLGGIYVFLSPDTQLNFLLLPSPTPSTPATTLTTSPHTDSRSHKKHLTTTPHELTPCVRPRPITAAQTSAATTAPVATIASPLTI